MEAFLILAAEVTLGVAVVVVAAADVVAVADSGYCDQSVSSQTDL